MKKYISVVLALVVFFVCAVSAYAISFLDMDSARKSSILEISSTTATCQSLVLADDDRAVVCHGVVDDVLSGEVCGLALYLSLRAYCNIHAGGYHDRAGELVVLGLGHKVSREVNRVRSLICKY